MAKKQTAVSKTETNSEKPEDKYAGLENRFARIKTRGQVVGGGAIYHRARILVNGGNTLTISYFGKPEKKKDDGKPEKKKDGPELHTDMIKKVDIVEFQLFAE